jgi:hypothetical protein
LESLGAIRLLTAAALLGLTICPGSQAASEIKDSAGASNEIWIAARNDGVAGTGTSANPYDGSTQAKLDSVMAAISANRIIHVGPGTFVTRGIVPKSGWSLYLSPKTTLRLDVLPPVPAQKWAIFGAGCPDSVSNIHVEGGVWDCNLQNQVLPIAAQAVAFITGGGNVEIKGIKVINWGSTLEGAEAFVVSVFNVGRTGKISRNIVFDGIEVTQPAPITHRGTSSLIGAQGQDPANPQTLSNGWMQKIEIKNCYVHDFTSPLTTASIQMGSWCDGVHIHHNRLENLGPKDNTLFGCYLDTGASNNVLIEKNVFAGVVHGIWVNLATPYPATNWIIRDNRIEINRYSSSGGIELRGVKTTIKNVLIERNVISSRLGQNLSAPGIALSRVTGGSLRDNVIDGMKGPTHIVFEKAVAGVELYDNRKQDGATISVSP